MRILLFSGKGGVGKTSLSAATGTRLAELGYRTLVMSVDPAHSLADAFDLDAGLFDASTAEPRRIADRLWIHEVNIQREIKEHWHQIWSYISGLLHTSGLGQVEAEEMAIFPGMEELSALLYVNEWHKEGKLRRDRAGLRADGREPAFCGDAHHDEVVHAACLPHPARACSRRCVPSPIAWRHSSCRPTAISPA